MKEKRILLVDEEALVNTFRSMLEKEGYRVETALTGQEPLMKAGKAMFDLLYWISCSRT